MEHNVCNEKIKKYLIACNLVAPAENESFYLSDAEKLIAINAFDEGRLAFRKLKRTTKDLLSPYHYEWLLNHRWDYRNDSAYKCPKVFDC